jgi:hypothetical protein
MYGEYRRWDDSYRKPFFYEYLYHVSTMLQEKFGNRGSTVIGVATFYGLHDREVGVT